MVLILVKVTQNILVDWASNQKIMPYNQKAAKSISFDIVLYWPKFIALGQWHVTLMQILLCVTWFKHKAYVPMPTWSEFLSVGVCQVHSFFTLFDFANE